MLAYNMTVNTEEAAGRVDTKDENAVLPCEVADDPFPTITPKARARREAGRCGMQRRCAGKMANSKYEARHCREPST